MADLSSLFQVAPGTASYFTGQNQALASASEQLKQVELAQKIKQAMQESEFNQQLNPLKLEQQRLTNKSTELGLPGISADVESKQAKAKKDTATVDTDIAATNAENNDKADKVKFEQFNRASQVLLSAGAQIDSVPGPARKGAFEQMIRAAGIDPNRPQIQGIMNMPPEQMSQAIKTLAQRLGDQALLMNPAARASMYSADQSAAAHRYSADKTSAATRYSADKRAEARKGFDDSLDDISKLEKQLLAGKVKIKEAMIYAQLKSVRATSDEEKALWADFSRRLEQFQYNASSANGQGKLTLDSGGNLTPRTIEPTMGGEKPKRGTGTADDPIVLK
jgi:hypothetical protein